MQIISYYPGGGGNRYYRCLVDKEWKTPNTSFDFHSEAKEYTSNDKYYLDKSWDRPFLLTHCRDTALIRRTYPKARITVIKTKLKDALCREWNINGRYREAPAPDIDPVEHYNSIRDESWPECNNAEQLNELAFDIYQEVQKDFRDVKRQNEVANNTPLSGLIQTVERAWNTIDFHWSYYQDVKVDDDYADQIIDINDDYNLFCVNMQRELEAQSNELFDEVWKVYYANQ